MLTRFPDVLATRHADVDEEQLWEDVSAVTAQALDRFVEMRAAEGAKMKADVENRLNFLEERVGRVEALSAGRVEAYTNRLYETQGHSGGPRYRRCPRADRGRYFW